MSEIDDDKGWYDKYICPECKEEATADWWCLPCNAKHFEDNFPNWSSGNKEIDEFIKEAQLTADAWGRVVEWIDWDRFTASEKIGQGGYSTIYKADWIDGPIDFWNANKKEWVRGEKITVALKSIPALSKSEFDLKEVSDFRKLQGSEIVTMRYLGVTLNPANGHYSMAFRFADYGDLGHFSRKEFLNFTWTQRLEMLRSVAGNLKRIHDAGYCHRDFHSGNILIFEGNEIAISDFGLCEQSSISAKQSNRVIGVMPYIPPEVFNGKPYTEKADIYGLGMMMWQVTSGEPPFAKEPHDSYLAADICDGKRPKQVSGTPPFLVELIERCWNADPLKRPSTKEIKLELMNANEFPSDEIRSQLNRAEEVRRKYKSLPELQMHPDAYLHSRPLPLKPEKEESNIPKQNLSDNDDDIFADDDDDIFADDDE